MANCPECGATLPPGGMCVACLLSLGLDGAPTAGVNEPGAGGLETELLVAALQFDSFGPYRIVRVLGEGGMGAVYLAEQIQPLRRQVALKVVKLGLNSREVLTRFNYERQALALMDHPNIAHVYDAGVSAKGRPYFAMEYIDGVPITQYCDQHRLNTRERLELFIPVCEALQHAHQKGIIHRDIKPSNVMVMEQDGRPAPKVIDFGIAKATDRRVVENGTFTGLGQFIGTPEYMSPEQADIAAGDVDTSSDVYSLAVLLYELIIGAAPFDTLALRRASLVELLRTIREDEAVPMTAKLMAMGNAASEIAVRRRTDAATLRRQVTGDLNWIVMKAMEKDRRRRYPAVSELAADIRRHLQGQPVLASPPSTLYRAGKFVRRHRLPVMAAAAVFMSLVAGIAAASWQAAIARRERTEALRERADAVAARALAEQRSREATAERNRAEEQTALAVRQEESAERERAVAEARLEDVHALAGSMLFELNDQVKDLAGGTKARETLVRLGQQYLNKEAAVTRGDPRHRRELAEALIKVGELEAAPGQSSLRDFKGAHESFARSVAILEGEVKASPQDPHIRHLLTLAYLRLAWTEWLLTGNRVGYPRALQSADIFCRQRPDDPQGLRDRAEALEYNNQPLQAVEIHQQVLKGNPQDPKLRWELARSESHLGGALLYRKNQEALGWLRKAADGFESLSREEPANIQYQGDRAVALYEMSTALVQMNRLSEAENRARESVAIIDPVSSADLRNAGVRLILCDAKHALATALFDEGQVTEAGQNLAMAIAIQEEQAVRFPDNPDFPRAAAAYYRESASQKTKQADKAGALAEYRKAEAIDRKLAARFPGTYQFSNALRLDLQGMGDAYSGLLDLQSALRFYREAVEVARAGAGSATPDSLGALAGAYHSLSLGFSRIGGWDEAIAAQRAALEVEERRLAGSPGNQIFQRSLSGTYRELARLYDSSGDSKSAVAASEKALPFMDAEYAAHGDDLSTALALWEILFYLRNQYTNAGDYDRGIAAGRRAVEIAEKIKPGNLGEYARNYRLSASLLNLGGTLRKSGRREESLSMLQRAIASLGQHPVEEEPSPSARQHMADLYLLTANNLVELRRPEDGLAICKRIMPMLEALVHGDPANRLYRETLARAYDLQWSTSLSLGDVADAMDAKRHKVEFQPAPTSPRNRFECGEDLVSVGFLELRLGRRDIALKTWREALELFQTAVRGSEERWSADRANLGALGTLQWSEGRGALTLEQLGDLQEAFQYRKSAYRRALGLLQADRSRPVNVQRYRLSQALAVRGLWLMAGEKGDYSIFFENGNPTRDQIRAALAMGWRDVAESLATFGGPAEQRMEAAKRALELDRELTAANSGVNQRVLLAQSLLTIGDVYEEMAHLAGDAEKSVQYLQSRHCYDEAVGILDSLKKTGELQDNQRSSLITLTLNLAALNERLGVEP